MASPIDAGWITGLSNDALRRVLCEFRYYFHRFTPNLALVIGNAKNQIVRQLLMPNLVEECGGYNSEPSHLDLLDSLLRSCGIENPELPEPYPSTVEAERWFFDLYRGQNTLASLCAIGPATESISGYFLIPLRDTVTRVFTTANIDTRYFEVHLSETEDEHVKAICSAISTVRKTSDSSDDEIEGYIANAIGQHQAFWDGLKRNCR